jgi:hypothetical protein
MNAPQEGIAPTPNSQAARPYIYASLPLGLRALMAADLAGVAAVASGVRDVFVNGVWTLRNGGDPGLP